MTIKQLSVFAENKNGALYNVTNILGNASIDIRAFSVADTQDFGVLRLIVSDTDKAQAVLSSFGIVVSITEVIGAEIPDSPGGLASVLKVVYDNNIAVEYLYAFVSEENSHKAYVVLRVNDNDAVAKTMLDAGITLIDDATIAAF